MPAVKPLPLLLGLFCAALATGHAQEQEPGLLDRIDAKRKLAIQSMNGDGKINSELSSPLASKSYGSSGFATKNFRTASFAGTKSAEQKTFATKSFLGIKNPWFGKTTFKTAPNREASQVAREADQPYRTEAYAVNDYTRGQKKDLIDADAALPASTQPRKYLGPEQPDKSKGVDKFTQNLTKDLSIDDVRDLLNKGKGE